MAQATDSRSCLRRSTCGCANTSKSCLTTCPHVPVYSSKKWKIRTGKKCGGKLLSKKTFKVAKTCTKKKSTPASCCC